jgi:hypothetical protein
VPLKLMVLVVSHAVGGAATVMDQIKQTVSIALGLGQPMSCIQRNSEIALACLDTSMITLQTPVQLVILTVTIALVPPTRNV